MQDSALAEASTAEDLRRWLQVAAVSASLPLAELRQQLDALASATASAAGGDADGEASVQTAVAGAMGQLAAEVREWGNAERIHYESLQARVTQFRRSLRSGHGNGNQGGVPSGGGGGTAGLPSDDECTAWLATAGAASCVDEDVVEQFTDDLLAARDACVVHIRDAHRRWAGVCERLGMQQGDECGGWSQSDHATFAGILRREAGRATAKRGAQASTRAALTDALAKQLPSKSAESIERHLTWSEERSSRRARIRDAKQTFDRDAQELVARARRSFATANAAAAQRQQREAELQAVVSDANAKRAKLRALQRAAASSAAAQSERQAEEALRAAAEEAAAAKDAARRAAQQRQAVTEWQHAQARSAAAAMASEAAHSEAMAAARAAAVADAAPRVAARAQALETKREQAAAAAREAQEEEDALAQRLAAIKQQASYAEAVSNVQRDTARLQSHTTASHYAAEMGTAHAAYIQATSAAYQREREAADAAAAAQGAEGGEGGPITGIGANNETMAAARQGRLTKRMAEWRAAEKGHFAGEREGLSDARVFSDVRSKLAYALHAAGLTGTDYAGQVIRQAARPVPRAMATQHNFQ